MRSLCLKDGEPKDNKISPQVWRDRFGDKTRPRFLITFLGGFLVIFGVRLAGGCTAGT